MVYAALCIVPFTRVYAISNFVVFPFCFLFQNFVNIALRAGKNWLVEVSGFEAKDCAFSHITTEGILCVATSHCARHKGDPH